MAHGRHIKVLGRGAPSLLGEAKLAELKGEVPIVEKRPLSMKDNYSPEVTFPAPARAGANDHFKIPSLIQGNRVFQTEHE